ncbi:hypothetical protein KM043_017997 [Ampulex compressa]|nr:hypothetical protein KM043_017997 [Ampulex compressa]
MTLPRSRPRGTEEEKIRPRSARFLRADDMLMYGRVVHKRVWRAGAEGVVSVVASTSQSRACLPPCLGPKTSGPRRPESLSPCLLHLHTMPETSAARAILCPPPFPLYHPNIVNMAAHRNYRKRNGRRACAARVGSVHGPG